MNTIIVAGAGISATQYHYPEGLPIMAVSSGYKCVPEMAHFVSMDKPMMFPSWLTDSDKFTKHTPDTALGQYWKRHPNVQAWPYEDGPSPTWTGTLHSGEMVKDDCDQIRHNSLLLAVQIAPRLGYDRLLFIGCDMLDEALYPLSQQLHKWHQFALDAGLEWVNASPLSTLCQWMPYAQESEMMAVMEVAR
jgi:hypothetical protein